MFSSHGYGNHVHLRRVWDTWLKPNKPKLWYRQCSLDYTR
jgi:hypothetical protein